METLFNDEITNIILTAVMKQKQNQPKKESSLDELLGVKKLNTEERARKSAETARKFFRAYLEQGFNENEAFELTKNNFNSKF